MNQYIKREEILDSEVCKGIKCKDCPFAEEPENPMESIKVPKMPTAIQPINGKPTISPLGADMKGN